MKKILSKCTGLCKNHIENAHIIISNKGKGNMANIMYYDHVTVPNDYCYIYQQQLEGKDQKKKKRYTDEMDTFHVLLVECKA